MKPHPRIRKTTKWTGAAVSVVLVGVWVGSVWYIGAWRGKNGHGVDISGGRLNVSWPVAPGGWGEVPGWHFDRYPTALHWMYERSDDAIGTWIALPIWPIALSAAIVTLAAWRLDTLARRRARPGMCPKCGYDRAGLPEGAACPECGAGAPSA